MRGAMESPDYVFKVLLSGDSGVGKSSLLMRFTSDLFDDQSIPTIGVDFRTKFMRVGDKQQKLTIWDTAGQERFRTLTSTYYRGAQGVIFVYDVTRSETFESLENIWLNEWEMYSTVDSAVKMVVGNKVDLESEREVSTAEGEAFARRNGCLFVETSAKMNVAVAQAFEELVLKIQDTPALLEATPGGLKMAADVNRQSSSSSCC